MILEASGRMPADLRPYPGPMVLRDVIDGDDGLVLAADRPDWPIPSMRTSGRMVHAGH